MHECLSVQGWIKAWGDPELEGWQLATCPRCTPARGNLADWLAAVEQCPRGGQTEARVFSLEASLLVDQARYVEAEALLERIESVFEAASQPVDVGRTRLQRAKVLACRKEYAKAALLVKAAAKHRALAVLRVLLTAIEREAVTQAILAATRRRIAALRPS